MQGNGITRTTGPRLARAAIFLAWAALSILAGAASADLRYTRGFGLRPNPPLNNQPTTFDLYGIYPTGCGVVEDATVIDNAHVAVRVRSFASCPPESAAQLWVASFELGVLAAGNHTLSVELTMDHPDSGVTVQSGSFTFGVEDSSQSPPPPPPPPDLPLVSFVGTDPYTPTSDQPVALIVGGFAPFGCPVVSEAAILDTSHLALTLSPSGTCTDSTGWSHRFELGLQREGHHFMDLAITVGDSVTHHVPIDLLMLSPIAWPPPPADTIPRVLSRSHPNPFSVESRFSVTLEDGVQAEVAVFDVVGRRVRTVFSGRFAAGTTELAWNGRREDGSRAQAGIYFYRLTLPGRVLSTRLVLLPQP